MWQGLLALAARAMRPFLRWGIRWFAGRYGYDTAYLAAMLDHSPGAFLAFTGIGPVSLHRRAAPVGAWFAAKLVGAMSEDCGPCTQLVVDLAREAGVPEDQLRAVLERDLAAMSDDVRVGFRFAQAVVGRSTDDDAVRDEVRGRWGDAAVVDLALALSIGRVFPMTKAGLGFAKECRLVRVGDVPVVVRHVTAGA